MRRTGDLFHNTRIALPTWHAYPPHFGLNQFKYAPLCRLQTEASLATSLWNAVRQPEFYIVLHIQQMDVLA